MFFLTHIACARSCYLQPSVNTPRFTVGGSWDETIRETFLFNSVKLVNFSPVWKARIGSSDTSDDFQPKCDQSQKMIWGDRRCLFSRCLLWNTGECSQGMMTQGAQVYFWIVITEILFCSIMLIALFPTMLEFQEICEICVFKIDFLIFTFIPSCLLFSSAISIRVSTDHVTCSCSQM